MSVVEWSGICPQCGSRLEFYDVERLYTVVDGRLRVYAFEVKLACQHRGHRVDITIRLVEDK